MPLGEAFFENGHGAAKPLEQLVQFFGRDDQRRAKDHRIAQSPDDDALFQPDFHDPRADLCRRFEGDTLLRVREQLDGTEQPDAANFADELAPFIAVQCLLELRNQRLDMAEDIILFVNFQRFQRDRAAYRVARIGEAMAKGADIAAVRRDGRLDLLIHHHCRYRRIA